MTRKGLIGLLSVVAACAALVFAPAGAQEVKPIKIGFVTFLSGPPAGAFGVPARNGAEITIEALNAGTVPAPYATKGFGGAPLEVVYVDEAGGTTKQVSEYRNLVQRQGVDVVIGYISSGDCLAVAPLADELKKLTVFFDCGTPRIFEDASYKHLFRTGATGTMDNAAAALYVTEMKPQAKSIAGINQNYAWGQDSWTDFEHAMKALKPGTEVATSQMPKLFAGQFGAEISTLLGANADIVHSSFWGADLEGLILQGAPRGLFQKSLVVLSAGEPAINRLGAKIPDGTIIGARGPYGPFAPDTALAKWFKTTFEDRYNVAPELRVVQGGAGAARREGGVGEGAGRGRRQDAHAGPGDRRVREPGVRGPRRARRDVARQGSPGGDGQRHRHDESGGWQADDDQRQALPGGADQPAGWREERGLAEVGLQGALMKLAEARGEPRGVGSFSRLREKAGDEGARAAPPLTCGARPGLHAGTARRARRMRLETPASPPTLSRKREREYSNIAPLRSMRRR